MLRRPTEVQGPKTPPNEPETEHGEDNQPEDQPDGGAQVMIFYLSRSHVNFFFSIFAGLTILCNFVMMVSWVPAWIILHHKLMSFKVGNHYHYHYHNHYY